MQQVALENCHLRVWQSHQLTFASVLFIQAAHAGQLISAPEREIANANLIGKTSLDTNRTHIRF
jgi:hypothetical protein